jgi:3-oxoacyl-[acyl-carrier protein] reductase
MGMENKVAIVTGGSRGIGKAIALELAARGAQVVVNFRGNAEAAAEVVDSIRKNKGQAEAFQADVTEAEAAAELIKFAISTFGDLHILVNNAGTTRDGLLMTMKEDDWDFVINTNLKSTYNCSRPAIRHMLRKRYGRIINVTSVAGQMGNPGQTNYSASKAGQIGFTKALAREVASRSVTVNAIAPGYIDTDLTNVLPEDTKETLLKMIPLGRMGQAEEIAHAAAYLASDEAGYITGHTLTIDGGIGMF